MAIKKTVSISIFDPSSLIVKSVFDCHLSDVGLLSVIVSFPSHTPFLSISVL